MLQGRWKGRVGGQPAQDDYQDSNGPHDGVGQMMTEVGMVEVHLQNRSRDLPSYTVVH